MKNRKMLIIPSVILALLLVGILDYLRILFEIQDSEALINNKEYLNHTYGLVPNRVEASDGKNMNDIHLFKQSGVGHQAGVYQKRFLLDKIGKSTFSHGEKGEDLFFLIEFENSTIETSRFCESGSPTSYTSVVVNGNILEKTTIECRAEDQVLQIKIPVQVVKRSQYNNTIKLSLLTENFGQITYVANYGKADFFSIKEFFMSHPWDPIAKIVLLKNGIDYRLEGLWEKSDLDLLAFYKSH